MAMKRGAQRRRTFSTMTKEQAINLLGGSMTEAARRVGVSVQAINQWPEGVLPTQLSDRVEAALWREHMARIESQRKAEEALKAHYPGAATTQADTTTA